MLYTEAVDAKTLELIELLQSKEYLNGFHLCGGTALSLYYGHRKSFDVDLFTNFSFDASRVLENLIYDFQFQLSFSAPDTLKGFIKNIKVDLLAHNFRYLQDPVRPGRISVLSEKDICAMKLNAIAISGQRAKDFIDIWYLLRKFEVPEILGFYRTKYNQTNDAVILKSLLYFDDVDIADWPILISDPALKWATVKKDIEKKVLNYIRGKS
ncbi:MAG: nucleotidyl transferase AbiEii/AbiGii toxin family protein [Bacteroidales bacterium]